MQLPFSMLACLLGWTNPRGAWVPDALGVRGVSRSRDRPRSTSVPEKRGRPMNRNGTPTEQHDPWAAAPRWRGVRRDYTAADVARLRGTVVVEHTLARLGAEKLWKLLHTTPYVNALGALTGNQALQ